jgi:hypothetical protein
LEVGGEGWNQSLEVGGKGWRQSLEVGGDVVWRRSSLEAEFEYYISYICEYILYKRNVWAEFGGGGGICHMGANLFSRRRSLNVGSKVRSIGAKLLFGNWV